MTRRFVLLSCLIAASFGTVPPLEGALPATKPAAPESYWREVPGGAGTMCGTGGRFSFWVHGENPRNFLVILGAGGGCWDAATCGGRATTDLTSDLSDFPARTGILSHRSNNPLRGYSVILIPYCTGDAHLGTRDATYGGDSTGGVSFVIHHSGRNNARAALKWAFRSVHDPAVIVVVGVGAGALASPMAAELIAEHYPKTRVVQIGNGAGGFRAAAIPGILSTWGVPTAMRESGIYNDFDSTQTTFEMLYTALRHPAPNLTMAQVNSASDSTQLRFLSQMGVTGMPLEVLLRKNLDDIRAARPSFRTYVIPGRSHMHLLSAGFFATYVDTVALRDWVANLVEGKEVHDVGTHLLDVPEPILETAVADSLHTGFFPDSLHVGAAMADSLHAGAAHPDSLHAGSAAAVHAGPAAPDSLHGGAAAGTIHGPTASPDSLHTTEPEHAPQDPAHH